MLQLKKPMNLTIIILAHNEEKTIKKHVEDIKRKIINKIKNTELIIFHDGSRDSTHEILLKLKRRLKFKYIYKKKRMGVHLALHKSLLISKGKKIFFTDSGNKFKLKDFWKLYKYRNKYDLLSGYRFKRQDQKYRMFLTKSFNIFLRMFTISKFYDIDSGFKIFDKKKLKKILMTEKVNSHFYMSEVCLKMIYAGSSYKEIYVQYFQRPTKSRALPVLKIPGMIFSYIKNFLKLKTILNSIENNFRSLG